LYLLSTVAVEYTRWRVARSHFKRSIYVAELKSDVKARKVARGGARLPRRRSSSLSSSSSRGKEAFSPLSSFLLCVPLA